MHIIRLFRGFEWDEDKARDNLRKHGLDFADATAVLEDYLTLGADALGRVIVVAYTWRGARIRLFSARRATAGERRQYQGKRR